MARCSQKTGLSKIGKLELTGFLGWLAWLFVHLVFLIGFRNRVLVMVEWAWAWFTYQRGARLITGVTVAREKPEAHPAQKS